MMLRAFIVPVLFGACGGAPTTKTVNEAPRAAPVAPSLPAPPMTGPEFSADPPGEPVRGEEEELLPPKVHVKKAFTRKIERARIEAGATPHIKAALTAAALKAAVTFDNQEWRGDQRQDLLAYLRGEAVKKDAKFTEADARIVAQLQAGSGALADGQLRDETIAVLFVMGFHFSARKAMPWEVKLEFYPGEVEDLDAWNREIDTKVTKNGGGYRDLDEPDGEGMIYVHVGRSLVASYRARGGPPASVNDDGEHVAGPTKPGVYRLGTGHAHVTSNWYYSQIPWGAEIRPNDGGYQYRYVGRFDWTWATSNPASTLKLPLSNDAFEDLPTVTRDGATFSIWNKNDFGPIAWNLVPSDMYVHTTPALEADVAATPGTETALTMSHGCVHIDPRERDEMMKWGYLGVSILFVVRRWDEHVLPDKLRREMLGL